MQCKSPPKSLETEIKEDEILRAKDISPHLKSPFKNSPISSGKQNLTQNYSPQAFSIQIESTVQNDLSNAFSDFQDKISATNSAEQKTMNESSFLKQKLDFDAVISAKDQETQEKSPETDQIFSTSQNECNFELEQTASKQIREFNDILDSQHDMQFTHRKFRPSIDPLKNTETVENEAAENLKLEVQPENTNQEFSVQPILSNLLFRRLFFFIRIIGCLAMMANFITEFAYLFRHQFSSLAIFSCYVVTSALKLAIPFSIALFNFKRRVIGKQPKQFTYDIDHNQRMQLSQNFRNTGFILYSAISVSYYSGLFRLMSVRAFAKEMGIGFVLDLFFTLVFLILQGLNNAQLTGSSNQEQTHLFQIQFQLASILLKLIALTDLTIELIIFFYEFYRLNQLRQHNLSVHIGEEKRRSLYASRYFKFSIAALSLSTALCLLTCFLLPSKSCGDKQSLNFGTVCTDCLVEDCLQCSINGPQKCDFCQIGKFFDQNQNSCEDCDDYKNAVVCKQCSSRNQCLKCSPGFRLGRIGTESQGLCLSCDDPNCGNCDKLSAECLECKPGFYLKGDQCVPCGGVCQECTIDGKCIKCDESKSTLNELTGTCECDVHRNWLPDITTEANQNCLCNSDYITMQGECSSCQSLIKSCISCQGKDEQMNNAFVFLGPPPNERPNQSQFLTCDRCLPNMYYNAYSRKCTTCLQVSPGCLNCDMKGQCQKCSSHQYLKVDLFSGNSCINCETYDQNCIVCSSEHCLQCRDGYARILNTCIWKFW